MRRTLDIKHETFDDVDLLRLAGSLDAESAGVFQRTLESYTSKPTPRIVLDCSDLAYVNSASLGLLNKYSLACAKAGGALAVAALAPRVLEIVKLLGLDLSLKICKSAEAAVKAVRS